MKKAVGGYARALDTKSILEKEQKKMSSSQDNHAVEMFWRLPELQENLMPFLHPRSILNLAKAFPPIVKILKKESRMRKLMWARLLDDIGKPWWDEEQDVHLLSSLLQLMGLPEPLLMDYLHKVCKESRVEDFHEADLVEVSCPCPMARHSVPGLRGFSILERIETSLNTRIQNVVTVGIEMLGKEELDVLGAQMRRQVEMATEARCNFLFCGDAADAENVKALFTKCQRIDIWSDIMVTGDIGEMGWAALAEALSMFPPGPWDVEVSRQNMLGGRRQDLRKVWDSLQAGSSEWVIELSTSEAAIFKREGEDDDGWDLVEEMMDLSEEEIFAKAQEEGVDKMEEDEEEGMGDIA